MKIIGDSGLQSTEPVSRPFLQRLARDAAGNALAIMGAMLFPLLALVGSGVDISRAYLVQTRLQEACDAGALAGRRAMTNGVIDDPVKSQIDIFFNFNFRQGSFGASNPIVTVGGGTATDKSVILNVTSTVPTTIMQVFGKYAIDVAVNCRANHIFTNTDVMFVLDVTGSMNCKPGEDAPKCPNGNNNEANQTGSKLEGLQDATKAFYTTMTEVAGNNARLRFGFMPYSSTVNVGKLLPSSYLVSDNWTYQSRRLANNAAVVNGKNKADCDARSGAYTAASESTLSKCVYQQWSYQEVSLPLSSYVKGSRIDNPVAGADGYVPAKTTWAGCIEERGTVPMADAVTDPNRAKAYDLDVDLVPNSRETRWRPYWPDVLFWRYEGYLGRVSDACPTQAEKLQVWTEARFDSYVDKLSAVGSTYHDIGLAWGARFLSPSGIFAAENPTMYNNNRVQRHLVFMTDGLLAPNPLTANAYGVEANDLRISGSLNAAATELTARHRQRVLALCNAIKSKGISIHVVAFAISQVPQELIECADNPSQVYLASDSKTLKAKFTEIAKNIGGLRLTQ